VPEHRTKTRLQFGQYFADIILNTRVQPPIYHWVIQREGDPEVLAWGTDRAYERACASAKRTMEWHAGQASSAAG
jgi:hypothetical protein